MTHKPNIPLNDLIPEWYVYERTEQHESESFHAVYEIFQSWKKQSNLPKDTVVDDRIIVDILRYVSEKVRNTLAAEIPNNTGIHYLNAWQAQNGPRDPGDYAVLAEISEFGARKARQDMIDILSDISLSREHEDKPLAETEQEF